MRTSATSAEEYVAQLSGWVRECVVHLRACVVPKRKLEETLKWGHIVYHANGPAFLIRAEPGRVLFGFWRGKRLRDIEPLLKPSGKYEMATLVIRSAPYPSPAKIRRLVKAAIELNEKLGNPQDAARKTRRKH